MNIQCELQLAQQLGLHLCFDRWSKGVEWGSANTTVHTSSFSFVETMLAYYVACASLEIARGGEGGWPSVLGDVRGGGLKCKTQGMVIGHVGSCWNSG